jgi:hypothetical protein
LIFERWIMAADSLGAHWSAAFTQVTGDLANVLDICREPALALELRESGPSALCALDPERRNELAAKVEPTLRPSIKHLLQCEALAMERQVGTVIPFRLLVLGRASAGPSVANLLDREFPRSRGSVISLDRPRAGVFDLFEASRHQLLWPELPARTADPAPPVHRLHPPRPSEPVPGELWNLSRLARLNPAGQCYSSFAARTFVGIETGDLLRYGGLALAGTQGDDLGPDVAADVLFASGARTLPAAVPVAFLRPAERTGLRDLQEPAGGTDRTRVLLHDSQRYGRIDFDPWEKTAVISVRRTKDGSLVATTTLKVHKTQAIARRLGRLKSGVEDELAQAIQGDLRGPGRREKADRQAAEIVALALPMATRYLEWLEWNPESPVAERGEKLADLEAAMVAELPPGLQDNHVHLNRRDLYKAFEAFLRGWGLRVP